MAPSFPESTEKRINARDIVNFLFVGSNSPLNMPFLLFSHGSLELHMEGLNMLRSLTDMDQKAYPERLGKLFIVNSPFVFVKVYSMIKKWLDPGGKHKAFLSLFASARTYWS
jgi:hypothetical protein